MGLRGAAILGAAIGQHAGQLDPVLIEERHHAVVQQVGGGDRGLAVPRVPAAPGPRTGSELGERHLGVGVDAGLLVDPPHPLERADVEGVLCRAVARTLAVELAMRLVVLPRPLQSDDLGFGQHQAVLCAFGLECLEPLLHGLQVVALPDTAHAGRGDRQAALLQLIGHPDLAKGRLFGSELDDRLLDGRLDPVLQDRLAFGHLGQRDLAAFLIKAPGNGKSCPGYSPGSCRPGTRCRAAWLAPV